MTFELIKRLNISQPENLFQLGIFVTVALIINWLTSNLASSKKKIRKLHQQIAQENAEPLRMALEAAQMGIWNRNLVTGKIIWSPEHEQLFGLAVGSFDGKHETFAACVHPEDISLLNQAVQQALQSHSSFYCEFRVVWPDGSIHWIEGRGHGIYNSVSEPVHMTGTAMAIDERKQTQGLLQQQLEQQALVMKMTQHIRQSLNLEDILQTTVEEVRQFLGCDRVIVFKFAPGWCGTIVVESVASEWMAILPLQIYDPCIGEKKIALFQQGLVTAKADIYNAGISPCHIEFLASLQVKANLVVPILVNDELWGLLAAHHCAGPREWQASEISLLQQVGEQVSIAIQQAVLFAQVQTELRERQQAEQSLEEKTAILRLFAKYAPADIAMFDKDMRYVMASQRWVDDYNLDSVESLIGRSHYEIFPEIPQRWRQIHQRCLAGFSEKCDEDLFVRADGGQQWLSWEVHPWYTATGEIGGLIFFAEDITQRIQTQLALQQLNVELEQRVAQRTEDLKKTNDLQAVITRNMAEGICLVKADNGVIVYANPKFEQMFGYNPGELNGQHVSILNYAHDSVTAKNVHRSIQSVILEQGEFTYEVHNVKKDGTPFWSNATASIFNHPDYGDVFVAVQQDITERKRIADALRESEEKFRQLAENIQAVFWMTDAKHEQVLYVSPAYESIWQRSCESLSQNPQGWLDAIHPEDHRRVEMSITELIVTGQYNQKYRIIRPDGSMRWISDRAFPIKNDSGEVIRLAGLVEDITEQQKIEEMKNEFMSIVSHELRTPLTAIQAALDLLNSGIYDQKPDRFKRMIEIASIDCDRLVRLVNDILDIERLESGKFILDKTTCQVNELIQQAVMVVQPLAQQQSINFNIYPTEAQLWIDADAIIQTLTNLLGNAIKFSPPHSTITINIEQQSDFVLVQVTDQGMGIPTDKLETIFEKFQQVDASDSRSKGGTGLGLAICRSIINQHGGRIWAESTLGLGSTFLFTLPVC